MLIWSRSVAAPCSGFGFLHGDFLPLCAVPRDAPPWLRSPSARSRIAPALAPELLHFFAQLRFDPADVSVRQRAVLTRVGFDLRAAQGNAV